MKSAMLLVSVFATAQIQQMVGDWATVDDKTGDQFAIVHSND